MTDNDDIVRVGALAAALYNATDDEAEILGSKFEAEIDRLRNDDPCAVALAWIAVKLLNGQPYSLDSNNPTTIARARSLAAHLGVTVTEMESSVGADRRSLRFEPRRGTA
jgi:hypothetical protein